MYFEWTDDFATGIVEIDKQHRQIIDYLNLLSDAGADKANVARVALVLDQLLDYTVNHFIFEEQLMEKVGYEFRRAHGKIHDMFGRRVAEYRRRFNDGEDVTDELLSMLRNWLARHIKEEDMAYVEVVAPAFERPDDALQQGWLKGMLQKVFG